MNEKGTLTCHEPMLASMGMPKAILYNTCGILGARGVQGLMTCAVFAFTFSSAPFRFSFHILLFLPPFARFGGDQNKA